MCVSVSVSLSVLFPIRILCIKFSMKIQEYFRDGFKWAGRFEWNGRLFDRWICECQYVSVASLCVCVRVCMCVIVIKCVK